MKNFKTQEGFFGTKAAKRKGGRKMAVKSYGNEERLLIVDGVEIKYVLTRKSVKNVNLRIDAAGAVKVSASRRVPAAYIEEFMRQHKELILKAVGRAAKRRPESCLQYKDGEQFWLLGELYQIKIMRNPEENVYLDNKDLWLQVKNPDNIRHMELMFERWLRSYQEQIYGKISRQIYDCYDCFSQFDIVYPEIRIRRMTSRWGSCQPYRGIITLNSKLIEMPLGCIEYVVLHEFCHFIHPDHSKAFHSLMTELMPDWKQRKKLLNEQAAGGAT
ncbi:MAG: M48 family metallopeptidase [Lachnospiraceae bacterium]|nr:M48 family metallopeptidase [Lachnospiraceae bacterium]